MSHCRRWLPRLCKTSEPFLNPLYTAVMDRLIRTELRSAGQDGSQCVFHNKTMSQVCTVYFYYPQVAGKNDLDALEMNNGGIMKDSLTKR